nr:reverse transcriptase domain-containing protein [Tanacetum cinerariifolium]
ASEKSDIQEAESLMSEQIAIINVHSLEAEMIFLYFMITSSIFKPQQSQDFQKKFEQKQDDFQNQMMQFMQNLYNKPSTSSSSLPSNTILNPKGEAKAITTRSGMSYKEPPILPTGVNQQEPVEAPMDTKHQNSDDIHPPTVQAEAYVTAVSSEVTAV